ncbi:hypothetical protein EZV61_03775 [Corallincola luteus]|uniref:HTH luxR-type domain-containing protein n=1 Tax=Corallincola luteus TaxID=1775177 RepID=A0ABY2API1_9GAMM|nr:LuxR C-terminal-related transcriptional regulator [Corallincola luteus]TCI05090.1 hypothetical protein EZV61_03775 [Corallincola luteus]
MIATEALAVSSLDAAPCTNELSPLDPLWQLNPALANPPNTRITLLHAPTGYGKSSLAMHWLSQWQGCCFGIKLDPSDNLLSAFVIHLTQVLNLPTIAAEQELSQASDNAILSALKAQLQQWQPSQPALLVCDNLHLITEPSIQQLLLFLFDLGLFKLILCSRHAHADWLSHYDLQGELSVVDRHDLQLSMAQVNALTQSVDTSLSTEWQQQTQQALQGWPAPWRMVLRLCGRGVPSDQVDLDEIGANLSDYLVQQTIQPLPLTQQHLLLSLVPFAQFDDALLTALDPQQPHKAWLSKLILEQLFISRTDTGQYQMVPFFRQALNHYLVINDPERLEIANHNACRALLKRQQWHAAAELVKQQHSPMLAIDWLESVGWHCFHLAHYRLLDDVFSLLSTEQKQHHPEIALLYGWWLLEAQKDSGLSNQWVQQLPLAEWDEPQVARFKVLQAETHYQFDLLAEALRYAEQALPLLTLPHDRLSAMFTRAMALLWLGQVDDAAKQLQHLQPLANTEHQHHIALAATLRLANVAQIRGDIQQAQALAEQAHELAQQRQLLSDHLYDAIQRTLVEIYLQQGDLSSAQKALERGEELTHPRGDYWLFPYVTWRLAIALLQGKPTSSLISDLEARLANDFMCRQWRHRARTVLQMCFQWRGEKEKLRQLEQQLSWHKSPKTIPDLQDNLLFGRNRLLAGQVLPHDFSLQAPYWDEIGACQVAAQLRWIEAMTEWNKGNSASLKSVTKTIQAWLEQRYIAEFLLLGEQGLSLWRKLNNDFKDNAKALDSLACWQQLTMQTAKQTSHPVLPPDERLTKKEWQVLQGIGRGYSNEQIAAQMHVALSTIKSHVNHIYSKLDINDRKAAKVIAAKLSRKD